MTMNAHDQLQTVENSSSFHSNVVWSSKGNSLLPGQAHEIFRETCAFHGFYTPPQHVNESRKPDRKNGGFVQMSLVRHPYHEFIIIVCKIN